MRKQEIARRQESKKVVVEESKQVSLESKQVVVDALMEHDRVSTCVRIDAQGVHARVCRMHVVSEGADTQDNKHKISLPSTK